MQIDYELTQTDFIDSFAAHRNRSIFSKWVTRLFMSLAIMGRYPCFWAHR